MTYLVLVRVVSGEEIGRITTQSVPTEEDVVLFKGVEYHVHKVIHDLENNSVKLTLSEVY